MEDLNLRAMQTMQQAFGRPVGFSDHTPGVGASPWAVALGASVVEKHFTLDRTMPGPDHRASIEADELLQLVQTVRSVEQALGDGIKRPMPSELKNKPRMQKSLVLRRPVRAGAVIQAEDLTAKRPGDGLPPAWMDRIVGKTARVDLEADTFIQLAHVEEPPHDGRF
jgi:sialic acid synthase SpsE